MASYRYSKCFAFLMKTADSNGCGNHITGPDASHIEKAVSHTSMNIIEEIKAIRNGQILRGKLAEETMNFIKSIKQLDIRMPMDF